MPTRHTTTPWACPVPPSRCTSRRSSSRRDTSPGGRWRTPRSVLTDLGVLHLPPGDVSLLLEDLRDVHLDGGTGHAHGVVVCRVGITQTRQHVCDRVGHRHGLVALLAGVSLGTFGVVGGRWSRPGRSLPVRRSRPGWVAGAWWLPA